MINILIVEGNLYYSKNLINAVMAASSEYKVCKIATEEEEVLDAILNKGENIDIILLDFNSETFDGLKFLDELKKNDLEEYYGSIIAISNEYDVITKIRSNPYLYTFINKLEGFERILESISELARIKEEEKERTEEKVKKELKFLKFSDRFVGTRYLYEAIVLLSKDESLYNKNLKTHIYPVIAKRHRVSAHNIKCNINNATVMMNCDCDKQTIMDYFGFFDEKTEVKPKQVIEEVLNKIRHQ